MSSAPRGWEARTVSECLRDSDIPRKASIPLTDYRLHGKYPIVDQGARQIGGYTDDQRFVYAENLPVILFGDHTRALKFLELPFATGADGTKLLFPNPEVVDAKFLFYALKAISLESRGYNRHFGLLRDSQVLIPKDINEQRAIATTLSKVKEALESQGRSLVLRKELKMAVLATLFREGLRGEKSQRTELGDFPRSWELLPLGRPCRITSGGTPAREVPAYWNGTIPWVKTGEIDYREITQTEEHITELGLSNSSARIMKKGTVLLAMYGQGVTRGKVAMLGIDAATNQACAALIPDKTLDSSFLYAYCTFAYERIRQLGHGANQKNLSGDILKQMLIPVPPDVDEQREIGAIMTKLGSADRVAEKQKAQLELLFFEMQHALTSGSLRIKHGRNSDGRH